MPAVLVIGGSTQTRRTLAASLPQHGFEPTFADTGNDGVTIARRGGFQLVLLEWALSDMPGAEVCRKLEASERTRELPIVVLTAIDTEIDRIVAFELGAVDYVSEPFSVRELLLRLRVALDGKRAHAQPVPPMRERNALLALDFEARRARVLDQEVPLSRREFEMLAALRSRPGVVLTRAMLRESVWGQDAVSLRTVDASVKRLRRKLGAARHAIETVRGVGYRFREAEQPKRSKVA
jgi:two-component system phosphate regulon response regulator PhoB